MASKAVFVMTRIDDVVAVLVLVLVVETLSHSCVIPTRKSSRCKQTHISVAAGRRETMRRDDKDGSPSDESH